MQDFKQVVYRTETKAYVIRDNTYTVPHPSDETVPAEIHREFDDLYAEVDAWAKENPDKVIIEEPYIPSQEELDRIEADRVASEALYKQQRIMALQYAPFSTEEFNAFAITHAFDPWEANKNYTKGWRFEHKGVIYECIQDVLSLSHQEPGSLGMSAIYRPLSTIEGIETEDGTREHPYIFIMQMDVHTGKYYKYEDKVYLAKADMIPCVWVPGTVGLWQWELVQ